MLQINKFSLIFQKNNYKPKVPFFQINKNLINVINKLNKNVKNKKNLSSNSEKNFKNLKLE